MIKPELLTRRDALQILAATPFTAIGACCARYPGASDSREEVAARSRAGAAPLQIHRGVLSPFEDLQRSAERPSAAARRLSIVDPHAHFFNASDVPVRGFIEECIGHTAPGVLQPLVAFAALIAEHISKNAPTAEQERDELKKVESLAPRGADPAQLTAARAEARRQSDTDRDQAAARLVKAIRDSRGDGRRFEQEYLRLKRNGQRSAEGRSAAPPIDPTPPAITEDHVKRVLERAEQPTAAASPEAARARAATPQPTPEAGADAADGFLAFLGYMLSMRRSNLDSYLRTFTTTENAIGIGTVFGALVDFDYWLDCPPRSTHTDQIDVHRRLGELYGDYFRPVVGYNPWTDIVQNNASLKRVEYARKTLGFVAVKIYPPTGFMPALNANRPPSPKRHPSFADLDKKLKAFFDLCAKENIPVISHTAHSNGRDLEHDTFGGPPGWTALLKQYAAGAAPTIDFGHFGGGSGPAWTKDFADLIKANPDARLYADLGYWEELMCPGTTEKPCGIGQTRLQQALDVALPNGKKVADRTMFATDWLMLSQVKRWADYPAQVRATLEKVAPDHVAAIMGGNARACFKLPTT